MSEPVYKRVLLKLSGEALMGNRGHGLDMDVSSQIVDEILAARTAGCSVLIVVGGGNLFRGMAGAARGMERTSADYMGMLATAMNGLALKGLFESKHAKARVFSAFSLGPVCDIYNRDKVMDSLEKGEVVIFVTGTGNPFFTTDTASTLRAIETECDALIKATQVDGIYSADPKTDPDAVRYDSLTYDEVLTKNLKVMDAAAIALARDNKLPVVVFALGSDTKLKDVVTGAGTSTVVVPA